MIVKPGAQLGSYVIESVIGEGGMATVYAARHQVLGSSHAIKVLHPELARHRELRGRFLEEGRIQAKLRHPNIVPVTDIIAADGVAGLVMPRLKGTDLGEHLERHGPVDLPTAIRWMQQALSALAYVHSAGVVHRDLKPGNLFLEELPDGERQVRVMDFGIAKVVARSQTRTGVGLMGTMAYMSPEQLRSPRSVDHRSDLFVLGAVLYEMLTGHPAFTGETDYDTQVNIVEGRLPPLRRPELSEAVENLLARALATDRQARFSSAEAFSAALQQLLQTTAPPSPAPQTAPRTPQTGPRTPQTPPRPPARAPRPAPRSAPRPPARAPRPGPRRVVSRTINRAMFELLHINAGTFWMGSAAGSGEDTPQHKVTLSSPFLLGKTPITQGLWTAIMEENPSAFKSYNQPVEQVSWFDCARFCNRLSALDGLTPAYTLTTDRIPTVRWSVEADGYRLPTEAEWEHAARAGTQLRYAGADTHETVGWFASNSDGHPHPVGHRRPNAWGLYDMSGNVEEWVWDRGARYTAEAQRDPTGPPTGAARVVRGGSWRSQASYTPLTCRSGELPERTASHRGLRIARNAIETP